MEKKTLTYLFFIIFFGFALRFSYLVYNPPSLNWDEVSHGYNAYAILATGADQWGQKFPLINFRAYGDYPTPLNLYLTIPFLAIFGLNEFAIRFPHVLLGVLTIISVYFLAWGITKRKDISLLSAFLVAIGPWYIFTSRFVLQANLSVFLLITSAALFFNREKNKFILPISFFLLFLTLFSYHTTRIFSPLFLLGLIIIYRKEITNRLIYIFTILFIGLSIFILINPDARARSKYLTFFDQGAINKIESMQNKYSRVLVNKLTYSVYKFGTNYVSYFSPNFLFFNGGTQYQFSIPKFGLIYPVNLTFFYIGLLILIWRSLKEKNFRTLLLWLILSPLPAALTNESYAVVRATTMLPLPEILTALGFYFVLEKIPEKTKLFTTLIYIIVVLIFLENYLTNYFTSYRNNYSYAWEFGYKEVVNYAKDNYNKYDKIIVTKKYGEPHEYFLFFLGWDPAKYQNDMSAIRFYQSNWYWVDKFDKFYFVNDWQIKDLITESKVKIDCKNIKCLLITSPGNFPSSWRKMNTVNFLDGKPAFEIYDNN